MAGSAVVPVAWVGRVSTDDQQDPVGSLLRQVRTSQSALPPGCEIVAYFYDVESGRKDLDARGAGRAHERFGIPLPRAGGIQDLLAEAAGPERRFEAVICEQIDRIARRTYYGTLIEHQLQSAGVALWAADERIDVRPGVLVDPTSILTRRVKQGVAEWYALDMLKRAWDGFETHTEQGYNVGKPCYGFRAEEIRLDQPHDDDAGAGLPAGVAAMSAWSAGAGHHGKGRAGPRTKTRLRPEPVEAAVVVRIYQWRVVERLAYQDIADRRSMSIWS